MIHPAIPLLLLALAGPAVVGDMSSADSGRPDPSGIEIAQVTIHERVIVRVPKLRRAPVPTPTEWKERKGPKCVNAADMGGALVGDERNVDIVLVGNSRVRARLRRGCSSMDFYSGFYLRPGEDGMVCADRDRIRMRSGASCEISDFKRLEPKEPKR